MGNIKPEKYHKSRIGPSKGAIYWWLVAIPRSVKLMTAVEH